ncbi:MAG: hypothetical protein HYV60_23335 [Planctomycetia bacterium]|nr:hypothetical protein [Planctomycetia bacterium]
MSKNGRWLGSPLWKRSKSKRRRNRLPWLETLERRYLLAVVNDKAPTRVDAPGLENREGIDLFLGPVDATSSLTLTKQGELRKVDWTSPICTPITATSRQ